MKKTSGKIARKISESPDPDRDTTRSEYKFSKAVRGITAARYRKGTNIAVLDGLTLLRDVKTAEAQIASGKTMAHTAVAKRLRRK